MISEINGKSGATFHSSVVAIVQTKGDRLLSDWRHRGTLVLVVSILRINRNVKARQGALITSRQELMVARVGSK